MNNEVLEALKKVTRSMASYVEVSRLVDAAKYDEALVRLENSCINKSTRAHLTRALMSKKPFIIESIFAELNSRIAQAMCWDCWRR